jgi:regulatory protein
MRDDRSPKPTPQSLEPKAYLDGLKMLGRRELSEAQVRERLARRQHAEVDIDAAVGRLKHERAIDDLRVAEAIARTEVIVKRRGRLRVKRQIESAGIDSATAKHALDDLVGGLDEDAMIEAALAKRLGGRDRAADQREFQKLHRYLVGQGFEPDRVSKALRGRRPDADWDAD